jgi:hypothetical protein
VGELERIRPSLGASFGQDLGHRVTAANDRPDKKHHDRDAESPTEDAVELHDEAGNETKVQVVYTELEWSDRLDLSA